MQLSSHGNLAQVDTLRYAFFDGDNVGNTIENLLNTGRITEATHLSESIKLSIFQIELFVKSIEGVEMIIAGGDDLLIRYDFQKYGSELLKDIADLFTKQTGLSISCGVGNNVSQAINSLVDVKQQNKGTIKVSSAAVAEYENYSTKQTKLYIFTTSDVPDPYINVIAHCKAYYPNLNQIVLIGITEDRRKINSKKDELAKLKKNIDNQLDSLVKGTYLKKKGKQWEETDIHIDSVDCQMYAQLKDSPVSFQVLIYQDLEDGIKKFLDIEDSVLHVFDVTAVLKSYLVDIYSILRFRNIGTIHSFELFSDDRSYDDKELIHNQTFGKTYDFTCLSESSYTRDRIIVSENSVISENEFNSVQLSHKRLKEHYKELENTLLNDFARLCSFIYFLALVPVFLWICWSITQPDGWNKIEPLAFITTFGWLLLNYFLQSLFTGRFPSADPRELFNASKKWRKKRLREID